MNRTRRTTRTVVSVNLVLLLTTLMTASAAHAAGRSLTSSETCTWVRNHFRTALSQVKPEVDQLLLETSGNRRDVLQERLDQDLPVVLLLGSRGDG